MTTIDNLGTQITAAAHEAWKAMEQTLERVGLPVDGDRLNRVLRPPVDRTMARFRWSAFGTSAVVPFPSPAWDDPRKLVTLLGLANVVYAEIDEHHLHQRPLSNTLAGSTSAAAHALPLPPVTLALVAASLWRFTTPALLRDVCLSPYCVVDRREFGRLWAACLTHMDAPHLMSNLAALLPDAAALERQEGSGLFAADVAALTTLSSGLFVGWAVFEKAVLHRPNSYYAVGALGLSSLAFALQVVADESRTGPGERRCLGLPLPGRFSWVVSLGFTHLVAAPDTSFAGHMAGVLAGIAHVYLVRPALRALLRAAGAGAGGAGAPRPRFYGSGTLSGRPVSRGATGGGGGGPGQGGGLRRTVLGALSQLGLAAGAIAVYALASQRRQRQPMSNWSLR